MAIGIEENTGQIAEMQNAQQPKPTTGPVSPEVQHRQDVQDKVDAAIKSAKDSDDISKINGPGNNNITSESFAPMKESLVQIDRKDLTPEAATNPLFNEKDAAGNYLPIYVIPNLGNDRPTAALVTMENGQRVIFSNEGAHQWTEAYVREKLMRSDADIKESYTSISDFIAAGPPHDSGTPATLYTEEQRQRLHSIMDSTSQYAKDANIGPYQIRIGDQLPSPANAETSREGNHYIILDAAALEKAISSDPEMRSFKGETNHEVTHIARGNTSLAGIMNNKLTAKTRKEEELADLTAAGPLGTGDPEGFAEYFRNELKGHIADYNKSHQDSQISSDHPNDQDLKKLSLWSNEPTHPADYDRLVALQDEARVMKQYESTHKVESLNDRKIESDAVIAHVMKDMQGKWQLPMPVDVETAAAPLSTPQNTPLGTQKGQTPPHTGH